MAGPEASEDLRAANAPEPLVLADAHVHVYECFDPETFLDGAHRNFSIQAARLPGSRECLGVLFLSEATGDHWFRRCRQAAEANPEQCRWSFRITAEPLSLIAEASGGRRLILVAGHQLVTSERLEVLALVTSERPPDGLPLADAVAETRARDGIPVIPWGAGKWLGRRGQLLRRFLDQHQLGDDLFLGDNSGRPWIWARPRHFRLADRLGIRVLPGSDPLPFPSQASRAGGFGFWGLGQPSLDRPAGDLRCALRDPAFQPRPYGALETPSHFIRHQFAMQLRGRGERLCEPS
jgi:hypothetical protein